MSLPSIDITKFYNTIDFHEKSYFYDIVCNTVIKKYNFSLREIAKYIRLTKIAAYKPTHGTEYSFLFLKDKPCSFVYFLLFQF